MARKKPQLEQFKAIERGKLLEQFPVFSVQDGVVHLLDNNDGSVFVCLDDVCSVRAAHHIDNARIIDASQSFFRTEWGETYRVKMTLEDGLNLWMEWRAKRMAEEAAAALEE